MIVIEEHQDALNILKKQLWNKYKLTVSSRDTELCETIAQAFHVADWKYNAEKGVAPNTFRVNYGMWEVGVLLNFRNKHKRMIKLAKATHALNIPSPPNVDMEQLTRMFKPAGLSPKQQIIMRMLYVDGMSQTEVGDALDITKQAVWSARNDSVTKLRNYVENKDI